MEFKRLTFDGDALVVTFDMCSSSDVLEQLTVRGNLRRYERMQTSMKEYLAEQQKKVLFDPYKFTGDGWILLFPVQTAGKPLLTFLRDLCVYFRAEYPMQVVRYLDAPPPLTGLTFGIDKGPVAPMTMFAQPEYFGRVLNVACRLQSAIEDGDASPAYRALVSNEVYRRYFSRLKGVRKWKVKRKLRNIRGGADFHCMKIELLSPTTA